MAGNGKKSAPPSLLAENRRAWHDYSVLDELECGVVLSGTEVKSARACHVALAGSYAVVLGGELFVQGMHIAEYSFGNRFNHETKRARKLLAHKKEVLSLKMKTEAKGLALVPLKMYLKKGRIKLLIGICRGKQQQDKRETLKERAVKRDMERAG